MNINKLQSYSVKINQRVSTKPQVSQNATKALSFGSLRVAKLMHEASKVPNNIWQNGVLVQNPEIRNFIGKLDCLNVSEKLYFVNAYCDKSGFPSLKKVTEKIDEEIMRAINKLAPQARINPMFVAYSSISSLGRDMALPGSDADGFYILTDKMQNEVFNRASVGFEMDQRIIESTGKHFPEVVSREEVLRGLDLAESKIKENRLLDKESQYKANIDYSGKSFVKAGELNIDVAETLDSRFDKMQVNLAGFFVELLRGGKVVFNNIEQKDLDKIRKTFFYKYSNMYRQEGLKGHLKPKLYNRIELSERFAQMTLEEQFNICKDLWEASFGVENEKSKAYHLLFDFGDVLDMYKKLGVL